MIACNQAQKGLSETAAHQRTAREDEYAAISRATRALQAAAAAVPPAPATLAAAVHANRQLWHLFAASVCHEENRLPRTLRAQLFYLAEFTDRHSREILRGRAAVDALVEVNTAVMRGLGAEAVA